MYVYKTTNLLNGKIYIGISRRDSWRSEQYLGSGKSFTRAVKKYGRENFSKQILEERIEFTYKDIQELEKYYIKLFNATDTSIGYNISQGGDGNCGEVNGMWGKTHSEEVINKIKQTKIIRSIDNPEYGKHTEKSRKKMSEFTAERNKTNPTLPNGHSEATKKKISETVTRMIASGEITREGKPFSDDKKALYSTMFSGEKNPFYGKAHTQETKDMIQKFQLNRMPPVVRMDKDENILEVYKHRGHVRLQGFREDLVKRCCNGFNTIHKGFKWKFITDEEFSTYKGRPEIDYKII